MPLALTCPRRRSTSAKSRAVAKPEPVRLNIEALIIAYAILGVLY